MGKTAFPDNYPFRTQPLLNGFHNSAVKAAQPIARMPDNFPAKKTLHCDLKMVISVASSHPQQSRGFCQRQVCILVQIYALAGKPNWWPRARLFVFSGQWFPQWFRWQITFKVGGIKDKNPWTDDVNVTQLLVILSQHLHVVPTMKCIQTPNLQCHHWYSVTLAIITRGQRQNDFRTGHLTANNGSVTSGIENCKNHSFSTSSSWLWPGLSSDRFNLQQNLI